MPPTPSRAVSNRAAYLLLFVTALLWAGNVIVGRAVRTDVPPIALSFARWAIAALLLTPFAGREIWQRRALVREHWGLLVWLALLGMTLYNIFSYTALAKTQAVNASVMISTMPVMIVVVSWLVLGQRITRYQALGIAVSACGVLLIGVNGDIELLRHLKIGEGDLWMLGAGVIWGFYCAYYTRRPPEFSLLGLLTVLVWIGLAGLLPFLLWEIGQGRAIRWTATAWGGMAYVGVFSSTLAYLCWNAGAGVVGPNRAALFLHLIPVFAIGLAVALLGERLYWYHWVGAPLVFVGLWLATRPDREARF